ncbi:hypothetical protein LZ32DRAFT_653832 [Colletotrichum eremochloae]|nr:hypothetical protein LZ32DRAFT_653832 [Colletotrichum eremochloae]
MHFLAMIVLVAGVARVHAHPLVVSPKVGDASPKIGDAPAYTFMDYYNMPGADHSGPHIETRSVPNKDIIDTVPSIEEKREAPVNHIENSKPENQAEVDSHNQARHEAPVDTTVDPKFKNVETRGYNHWGGGYGHGGGYGGWGHDGGYGGWGHGGGGFGAYGHDGGWGHGGWGDHEGYGGGYHAYDHVSSRASRGEHNTAADNEKYRDNLVKLDNGNCGIDCHRSLDSYRSVASKDSRLSRVNDNDYYYHYNHNHYVDKK